VTEILLTEDHPQITPITQILTPKVLDSVYRRPFGCAALRNRRNPMDRILELHYEIKLGNKAVIAVIASVPRIQNIIATPQAVPLLTLVAPFFNPTAFSHRA